MVKIHHSKLGKLGLIMNKLRMSILAALSGVTAFAHGGVTYTGEVETAYPVVKVESTEQPVAHVKDFRLQIEEKGGICDFTTDPIAAETSFYGGSPLCLFEWTGDTHGLKMSWLKAEGVLESDGQIGFDYQISIINQGEKTILLKDTYIADAEMPVIPAITEVKAKWQRELRDGAEQITYKKSDKLFGWEVEVEERPYPQLLTLNEFDCKVKTGETTCLIAIDAFSPGADSDEAQGVIASGLLATDQKSYFTDAHSTDLTINWDYRGPTAVGFAYNADNKSITKTVNVGGVDITLEPEEAVMVVSSPHTDKDGDWWKPQQSRIKLETELGSEHSDIIDIDGTRIRFDVPNFMYRTEFYLESLGDPEISGENMIYRYSTAKIPDGKYNVETIVEDDNENGGGEIYSDNVVDRYAPDIKALIGDIQLREESGTDLYFLNDLTFVANGGWPDGTKITSVKVNEIEAERENREPYISQLNNTDDMIPGTPVEVIVTAVDGAGNEAVKTFELGYMPVEFEMYNKPESLYSRVQETSMYLTQTGGMKCFMSGTKELAVMISGSVKKGCTVKFTELPDGLSPTFTGSFYKLEGAVKDVGQVPISYQVIYHNHNGSEAVAYENSFTIDVTAPTPLKLDVTDYNQISDGVYSIAHNGRLITRYEMDTVPARVNIDIENPFYTEQEEVSQRRMSASYTVRNTLNKKTELKPQVWDVVPFKINAYHVMDEYSQDSAEFDLVVTPSTRTRVYAEPMVDETNTLDTVTINARVGVYDRREGEYEFDHESMGDWKMHLAYKEGRDYIMITEEKDIDGNGLTSFDVPAQELFDLNKAYYAVANAKSHVDGFEMQIVSTPKYTRVLKGTAVEGSVSARTVEGPIPLSLMARYEFDSVDDMRVAGTVKWEKSNDGITWTEDPTFEDERMYREKLVQPQEKFLRVRTNNKITGIESVSEALKIVAYDVATINIEGPTSVYPDQDSVFTAKISDMLSAESDGVFEWSTDSGQTWIEGGETFIHSDINSYEIKVRHRLTNTSDDVGEEGYADDSHRVTLSTPSPLMVSMSVPRHGEVDKVIEIAGKATNRNSRIIANIISEIVTPSGDVIDGKTTEYLLTEADVSEEGTSTFIYRAWVEGYKESTYSERTEKVAIWSYEMPTPVMAINVTEAIAPAPVTATVSMASIYAPGVEFNFDWVVDEDAIEISSIRGKTATFIVNKPGMHLITVTVSDNRGNSVELTEFIDVVEADPMLVEVTKYSSNDYLRAPLVMTYRVSVDPGHPRDYSGSYEWFVDGVRVPDAESSFNKVEFETAGEYEVKVIATSRMGQVEEYIDTVEVMPNQPPVCEPALTETSSSITVSTNCSDSDGKIIKTLYQWGENEETSGSSTLRFSKVLHPTQQVNIRAVDDSGEEVTATIGW
jgi:hypothetical protein